MVDDKVTIDLDVSADPSDALDAINSLKEGLASVTSHIEKINTELSKLASKKTLNPQEKKHRTQLKDTLKAMDGFKTQFSEILKTTSASGPGQTTINPATAKATAAQYSKTLKQTELALAKTQAQVSAQALKKANEFIVQKVLKGNRTGAEKLAQTKQGQEVISAIDAALSRGGAQGLPKNLKKILTKQRSPQGEESLLGFLGGNRLQKEIRGATTTNLENTINREVNDVLNKEVKARKNLTNKVKRTLEATAPKLAEGVSLSEEEIKAAIQKPIRGKTKNQIQQAANPEDFNKLNKEIRNLQKLRSKKTKNLREQEDLVSKKEADLKHGNLDSKKTEQIKQEINQLNESVRGKKQALQDINSQLKTKTESREKLTGATRAKIAEQDKVVEEYNKTLKAHSKLPTIANIPALEKPQAVLDKAKNARKAITSAQAVIEDVRSAFGSGSAGGGGMLPPDGGGGGGLGGMGGTGGPPGGKPPDPRKIKEVFRESLRRHGQLDPRVTRGIIDDFDQILKQQGVERGIYQSGSTDVLAKQLQALNKGRTGLGQQTTFDLLRVAKSGVNRPIPEAATEKYVENLIGKGGLETALGTGLTPSAGLLSTSKHVLGRQQADLATEFSKRKQAGLPTHDLELLADKFQKLSGTLDLLSNKHQKYINSLNQEAAALEAAGTKAGERQASSIRRKIKQLESDRGALFMSEATGKTFTDVSKAGPGQSKAFIRDVLNQQPELLIDDLKYSDQARKALLKKQLSQAAGSKREELDRLQYLDQTKDIRSVKNSIAAARYREQIGIRELSSAQMYNVQRRAGTPGGVIPPGSAGALPPGGGPPRLPSQGFPVGGYFGSMARGDRSGGFLSRTKSVLEYTGAAIGVQAVLSPIYKAVETTRQVDQELSQLNKILNVGADTMEGLRKSANESAKRYGKSTAEVLQGMTVFAQQGLPLEEVKKRGDQSAKISRVSAMTTEEVTETVTAGLNIFGNEVNNSAETLMDSFLAVEAANAVSEQDLAEIMRRVGTSAKTSGLSVHELNAISTVIQERTRAGGERIGTALRFMLKNMFDPTVSNKLQKQFGVSTVDLETGQSRGGYEILKDLADQFQKGTPQQRREMAGMVGQTRFSNTFMALMEGFGKTGDVVKQSQGAFGEVDKRLSFVMQSFDAQVGKLAASFEGLVQPIGMGVIGPLKDAMKITESILDLMTSVANIKLPIGGGTLGGGFGTAITSLGMGFVASKVLNSIANKGLQGGKVKSNFVTNLLGVSTQQSGFLGNQRLSEQELKRRLELYRPGTLRGTMAGVAGAVGSTFTRMGIGSDATRLEQMRMLRQQAFIERQSDRFTGIGASLRFSQLAQGKEDFAKELSVLTASQRRNLSKLGEGGNISELKQLQIMRRLALAGGEDIYESKLKGGKKIFKESFMKRGGPEGLGFRNEAEAETYVRQKYGGFTTQQGRQRFVGATGSITQGQFSPLFESPRMSFFGRVANYDIKNSQNVLGRAYQGLTGFAAAREGTVAGLGATGLAKGVSGLSGLVTGFVGLVGPIVATTVALTALEKAVAFVSNRISENAEEKIQRKGIRKDIEDAGQRVGSVSKMTSLLAGLEDIDKQIAQIKTVPGLSDNLNKQLEKVSGGEFTDTLEGLEKSRSQMAKNFKVALLTDSNLLKKSGAEINQKGEILFEGRNIEKDNKAARELLSRTQEQVGNEEKIQKLRAEAVIFKEKLFTEGSQESQALMQYNKLVDQRTATETPDIANAAKAALAGEFTSGDLKEQVFGRFASTFVDVTKNITNPEERANVENEIVGELQKSLTGLDFKDTGRSIEEVINEFVNKGLVKELRKTTIRGEKTDVTSEMVLQSLYAQDYERSLRQTEDSAKIRGILPSGAKTEEVQALVNKASEGQIIKVGENIVKVFTDAAGRKMGSLFQKTTTGGYLPRSGGVEVQQPELLSQLLSKLTTKGPMELFSTERGQRFATEKLFATTLSRGFGAMRVLQPTNQFQTGPSNLSELTDQIAGTYLGSSKKGRPGFNVSLQELLNQAGEFQKRLTDEKQKVAASKQDVGTAAGGEEEGGTISQVRPTEFNLLREESLNLLVGAVETFGRSVKAFYNATENIQRFQKSFDVRRQIPITTTGPLAQFGGETPQVQLGKIRKDLSPEELAFLAAPMTQQRLATSQYAAQMMQNVAIEAEIDSTRFTEQLQAATPGVFNATNDVEKLKQVLSSTGTDITSATDASELLKEVFPEKNFSDEQLQNILKTQSSGGTVFDLLSNFANKGKELPKTAAGLTEEQRRADETTIRSARALATLQISAESAADSLANMKEVLASFSNIDRVLGGSPFLTQGATAPTMFRELGQGSIQALSSFQYLNQFQAERRKIKFLSSDEARSGRMKYLDESGGLMAPLDPTQARLALRGVTIRERKQRQLQEREETKPVLQVASDQAKQMLGSINELLSKGGLDEKATAILSSSKQELLKLGKIPESAFLSGNRYNAEPIEKVLNSQRARLSEALTIGAFDGEMGKKPELVELYRNLLSGQPLNKEQQDKLNTLQQEQKDKQIQEQSQPVVNAVDRVSSEVGVTNSILNNILGVMSGNKNNGSGLNYTPIEGVNLETQNALQDNKANNKNLTEIKTAVESQTETTQKVSKDREEKPIAVETEPITEAVVQGIATSPIAEMITRALNFDHVVSAIDRLSSALQKQNDSSDKTVGGKKTEVEDLIKNFMTDNSNKIADFSIRVEKMEEVVNAGGLVSKAEASQLVSVMKDELKQSINTTMSTIQNVETKALSTEAKLRTLEETVNSPEGPISRLEARTRALQRAVEQAKALKV